MTAGRRLDVFDLVHELCEKTQHREFYMRKHKPRYHTTDNPALLTQLYRSAIPSYTHVDGTGKVAGSRPAASVDAIDTATRIHTNAARWLKDLENDPAGDTITLVRRLGALIPSQPHCHRPKPHRDGRDITCCTAHQIEGDIRRWWTWARITTGWDLPAWQPDNTCPLCGTRGTIRIRLVDKIATCIDDTCRETWDETTIGLLADHIRTENGDTHQQAG